jgi:hypothetical protein
LGFVETVNFVDEQNRAQIQVPILAGVFDDSLNILFAGCNSRKFNKFSLHFISDNPRQGSFASAGWAPKYQANRFAFGDYLPQQFHSFGLANYVIQSFRPHAFG